MLLQARAVGKGSSACGLSEYDEYVPMVDKAVDMGWKQQVVQQNPLNPGGLQVQTFIMTRHVLNCFGFSNLCFCVLHPDLKG